MTRKHVEDDEFRKAAELGRIVAVGHTTSRTIYFGVDPGKSGAIAYIDRGVPGFVKFKETLTDVYAELRSVFASGKPVGVIEQVNAMPGQGVSSSFKFGQAFGQAEALLTALGAKFERVRPAVWQKAMGCLTKGDKNVTKQKAQELFPNVVVTHANADALLLAEYARRAMR